MPTPDKSATGTHYLNPASILRRLKLHPKMAVGDFGAGGGAFFALQAGLMVGDKGVVWAFDVYKPALSACATKAKLVGLVNIKTLWTNLEVYRGARAIGDSSLDAGILVNVLHESRKHREILRECGRMLKPGAKMLIIDWDVTGPGFGPRKEQLVPVERVQRLAQEIGLTVIDQFEPSRYHWAIVVVKK